MYPHAAQRGSVPSMRPPRGNRKNTTPHEMEMSDKSRTSITLKTYPEVAIMPARDALLRAGGSGRGRISFGLSEEGWHKISHAPQARRI